MNQCTLYPNNQHDPTLCPGCAKKTKGVETFYAISNGEKAAGIPALTAEVYLPMPEGDPEYLQTVKEELTRAFRVIFDDNKAYVLTDQEVEGHVTEVEELFHDLEKTKKG